MQDLPQEILKPLKMNNPYLILCGFVFFFLASCNEPKTAYWEFKETIELPKEVRPISIAFEKDKIWISDPQQNRVLKINRHGEALDSITGLQRPMNISFFGSKLYIPEYLADRILVIRDGIKDSLMLTKQLNAPASIDISASQVAIADFYSHRVVLKEKDKEMILGKKGHDQGQFYYPTDVKLYKNQIYVADAYNNRIQVFNDHGEFIKIIGADSGINVASGLDVYENTLAVTDQENNRVLIFDLEGSELQVLTEKINYPTDVILSKNELWIANFKTNHLTIFTKK